MSIAESLEIWFICGRTVCAAVSVKNTAATGGEMEVAGTVVAREAVTATRFDGAGPKESPTRKRKTGIGEADREQTEHANASGVRRRYRLKRCSSKTGTLCRWGRRRSDSNSTELDLCNWA